MLKSTLCAVKMDTREILFGRKKQELDFFWILWLFFTRKISGGLQIRN